MDKINNRYRIVKKIAEGGMGNVYIVGDEEKKAKRALKTLERTSESSREKFQEEFKLLSELRHPNLESVYDYGEVQTGPEDILGKLFFTSEFIDGKEWDRTDSQRGTEQLLDQLVQVCRALQFIHARNLIHYDVKPGNVLVPDAKTRSDKNVKLIDFGLAERKRSSGGLSVRGTIPYIAPELIRGDPVDGRADLYSLGVTLYELLTGELPFKGKSSTRILRAHLNRAVPDLKDLKENIPESLQEIIPCLLKKNPEDRPSSANEVIQMINNVTDREYSLETKETIKGYVSSPKFTGREEEISWLKQLWNQRTSEDDEKTALGIVTGPYGVGKSRLLKEFQIWGQTNSIPVITAKGEKDTSRPFGLFRKLLPKYVRQVEVWEHTGDSEKDLIEKFGPYLDKLVPELGDRYDTGTTPKIEDKEQEEIRLLEEISEFIKQSVGDSGVILLFDDIHWADDQSVELIRILSRKFGLSPDPIPVLMAISRREEDSGDRLNEAISELNEVGVAEECMLTDFDEDMAREFITGMFGQAGEQIAESVMSLEKSRNPLYLTELLRSSVEEGVIVLDEGIWRLNPEDWETMDITGGLEELVRRRLSFLKDSELRWLEYLALWGGAMFGHTMMNVLDPDMIPPDRRIRELKKRGLLKEDRYGTDSEYIIDHDQMIEVLKNQLSPEESEELYRDLLERLEKAIRERKIDQMDHIERLARFAREAGETKKFLLYAEEAGRSAEERFAYDMALKFYQSIDLEQLPDKKQIDIMGRIGYTLKHSGKLKESTEVYEKLLAEYDLDLDREIEVTRELSIGLRDRSEFDKAEKLINSTISRFEDTREPTEKETQEFIELLLDWAYYTSEIRGEVSRSGEILDRAETLFKSLSDKNRTDKLKSHIEYNRSIYEKNMGNLDKAIQRVENSLQWAKEENELDLGGIYATQLGILHNLRGDMQKALNYFERTLELYQRIGNFIKVANARWNLGVAYRYIGNTEKSVEMYESALQKFREYGKIRGINKLSHNLSIGYRRLGKLQKARSFGNRAIELSDSINEITDKSRAYGAMGAIEIRAGNLEEAREYLEESLKYGRQEEGRRAEDNVSIYLMMLHVLMGNSDEANKYNERVNRDDLMGRSRSNYVFYLQAVGRTALFNRDWDTAKDKFQELLELSREGSIFEYEVVGLSELGRVLRMEGNYSDAIEKHNQALNRAGEVNLGVEVPLCHLDLVHAYCLQAAKIGPSSEYSELRNQARQHLDQAAELLEEIENYLPEQNYRFSEGIFQRVFGDRDLGQSRTESVLEELQQSNHIYHRELFKQECDAIEEHLQAWWSDEQPDQERIQMPNVDVSGLEGDKISRLLEVLTEFSAELEPNRLLPRIMDTAIQLTEARRGFLAVLKPKENREEGIEEQEKEKPLIERLDIQVARNRQGETLDNPETEMSENVMEMAIAEEAPLRLENIDDEDRLRQAGSVEKLNLNSVIAAPLRIKGSPVGAIYLDRSREEEQGFDEQDLMALSILAGHAAVAIENARLHEEAIRDRLTGLVSHGYFQNRIEEELQKADRFGYPISLMFIDVDGLKWVNDRLGHAAGDKLISRTGEFLRETMRGYDVAARTGEMGQTTVGRYGGDEFEVLLPETSKNEALSVADRIVEDLQGKTIDVGDRDLPLSISIGISAFPEDGNEISELIEKADHAMQDAKKEEGSSAAIYTGKESTSLMEKLQKGFSESGMELEYLSRKNRLIMGTLRRVIRSDLQLKELLEVVLETLGEATRAQRGVVMLKGKENGDLQPEAFYRSAESQNLEHDEDTEIIGLSENIHEELSLSVAREVLESGKGILTDNASEDPGLLDHSTIERLDLKSLMVIPIRTEDEKLGVIYLDNPAVKRRFGEEDLGLASALAREITGPIKNAIRHREKESRLDQLESKYSKLKKRLDKKHNIERLAGESDAFQDAMELIENLISTESNVLITGENGTGKSTTARVLHYRGPRGEERMVEINCESFGKELQKQKLTKNNSDESGPEEEEPPRTFLIENIHDLHPDAQNILLERLEEEPELRVVSTTTEPLKKQINSGSFSEDLFKHLKEATVRMPSLEDRRKDIPLLANRFIKNLREEHGIGPEEIPEEIIKKWMGQEWPGNVAELKENVENYFFKNLE